MGTEQKFLERDLEELKAEFDALMSDEEGEEDEEGDIEDLAKDNDKAQELLFDEIVPNHISRHKSCFMLRLRDLDNLLRRISSSIGKCAMVFKPVTALNLSIWSVASLRLAITPPKRTL